MSYISKVIGDVMAKRKLTQSEVTRITGIDKASLSRWLNAQRTTVSDEDLHALGRLFQTDKDRASLTVARMMDAGSGGPGAELIQVSVGDATQYALRDEPPASHPFERALQIIRSQHHVKEVQDVIIPLATLIETGDFKPAGVTYRAKRTKKPKNYQGYKGGMGEGLQ
jgi:transcriptional regulator with XRE-family HTH domain